MMSAALQTIVSNGSRAAVIWLLLVLLSIAALAGLALPDGVRRPRQISAWLAENARSKRLAEERKAAAAAESIRYADEITVAARGAAATAERRREECQQAQAGVETAWQAYQDADEALARARRAAAFATSEGEPAEADRVQALRRSAQSAYRRGDLSDTQLLDALTHRNGWDAGRQPVEQELMLARAAVRHRFAAYQRALEVEQEAWRAADIATASVHSLRHEVTVAATLADSARSALAPGERTNRRGHRVAATA
jgi:hypothetical protein